MTFIDVFWLVVYAILAYWLIGALFFAAVFILVMLFGQVAGRRYDGTRRRR